MLETNIELATFAGGCFWCMEGPFAELHGVKKVVSGYTGGHVENPTYQQVCTQTTGHYEAVQISYDPAVISYERILRVFWEQIDPTDEEGQFCDRGPSYRTAIFFHSQAQKEIAEQAKLKLSTSGRFKSPIVVKILPAGNFYPAEEFHQGYHKKCPLRYSSYRFASGRDEFIDEHWDKAFE